jgi:hydroxypyruvate reductase
LESVHPSICIRKFLSLNDQQLKLGKQFYNINSFDNIYVVGAGKATAAMALATEDILGERIRNGIIAVKTDHGLPLRYIQQVEAGHPLPISKVCMLQHLYCIYLMA